MSVNDKAETHGAFLIIAASVLWAFGYLFRKTILYGISPLLLSFVTSCIVAIVFAFTFRFPPIEIIRAFRAHALAYMALALTGVVIGSTCMFIGLDHLDLGVTVILEKLQPVFTLLLATLFLRERTAKSKIPFMLIAVCASYFVSMKNPFDFTFATTSVRGIVAVVMAAFSWGLASVIGKHLTKVQPNAQMITLLRFALGAVMLLPVFIFRVPLGLRLQWDPYVVGVAALCAIFSTGLGYLLFYRGLRNVAATVSGFLELVTPVVGLILGMVFLREQLTVIQLVAAFALLWSIYLLCKPAAQRQA